MTRANMDLVKCLLFLDRAASEAEDARARAAVLPPPPPLTDEQIAAVDEMAGLS